MKKMQDGKVNPPLFTGVFHTLCKVLYGGLAVGAVGTAGGRPADCNPTGHRSKSIFFVIDYLTTPTNPTFPTRPIRGLSLGAAARKPGGVDVLMCYPFICTCTHLLAYWDDGDENGDEVGDDVRRT